MGAEGSARSRQPREGGAPPAAPPHRVRVPVNVHDWQDISFLHWRVDPAVLEPLVPDGTAVLTHDGSAWVGVTPFLIRVRPPRLPAVPWLSVFPETNVRTYVAGPDGQEGLWFLRMEVTRAWFVAVLRTLGLPYFRQRMSVERRDRSVVYSSEGSRGGEGSHRVVVRPGAPLVPAHGGPAERFLTARWGAYHRRGPLLMRTPADHPPWPLHAAEVEACDVEPLWRSAGLPPPEGSPVAHFSPGVTVRIGPPRIVA